MTSMKSDKRYAIITATNKKKKATPVFPCLTRSVGF